MNKYNIRAIRKELDDCIRSGGWKQFRTRFNAVADGNDAALCQAIVECRQRTRSARGGGYGQDRHGTLLHSLCCARANPPVPVDIVGTIAAAVPQALCARDSKGRTPLHVAIDRGGRLDVIRCLLQEDGAKESLSAMDRNGDTPLLLAVRSNEHDHSDVVRLLVESDPSKGSLLIGSKKRKRTPLWYVAADELSVMHGGGEEEEVSEELAFMLLNTHRALQVTRTPKSLHCTDDRKDEVSFNTCEEEGSDDEGESHYGEGGVALMLQAAIACYHLLGKLAGKLFGIILRKDLYRRVLLSSDPDINGNLMVHHVCMATVERYDQDLILGGDAYVSLLDLFLTEQNAALMLGRRNALGEVPLHLAIKSGKALDHIESIVAAYPHALKQSNACGELPLHVAIKHAVGFGSMEVARMLWKRYPEAAEVRDGKTRLFAFQLAGCCEWHGVKDGGKSGTPADIKSTCREKSEHDEVPKDNYADTAEAEQITSIYIFLLESPQVLQLFC